MVVSAALVLPSSSLLALWLRRLGPAWSLRSWITCSLFAFQIENKFSLNPKSDSCVRCGVIKAIEALQTSGSTVGATFILISQGKSTSLSSNFEKDLVSFFYIRVQWDLKSQLGVYTSPLLWVSFRGTQLLLHTHILWGSFSSRFCFSRNSRLKINIRLDNFFWYGMLRHSLATLEGE